MCPDPRYKIICGPTHKGWWRVIRVKDNKEMTSSSYPYTCLKWVRVWGPMRAEQ